MELAADYIRKMRFFKHKRCFIKHGERHIFYNAIGLYVAEVCNLAEYALVLYRLVATENKYIRIYPGALQFLYGVLRRL